MNGKEKLKKEFLKSVRESVRYWQEVKLTDNDTIEHRLNGLAFSILVLIDGDSSLNNFKHYNISYGGTVINDEFGCELHSEYYGGDENE